MADSLYPELAGEDFKDLVEELGKSVPKDVAVPEGDVRFLRVEVVRHLTRAMQIDTEILKIGSWDIAFLNQYLANLHIYFHAVLAAYPKPEHHLPMLRNIVRLWVLRG